MRARSADRPVSARVRKHPSHCFRPTAKKEWTVRDEQPAFAHALPHSFPRATAAAIRCCLCTGARNFLQLRTRGR